MVTVGQVLQDGVMFSFFSMPSGGVWGLFVQTLGPSAPACAPASLPWVAVLTLLPCTCCALATHPA